MPAEPYLLTDRLLLRRPRAGDAAAILDRYAGDAEVTRWLAWPRHRSVADTLDFIALSDDAWSRWHTGPLLIESRDDGRLLGSTGLEVESTGRASTGYVLARDAWGRGLATEALRAIVALAGSLTLTQLHACCHVSNVSSQRVLQRCGFVRQGATGLHIGFPNLTPGETQEALLYGLTLAAHPEPAPPPPAAPVPPATPLRRA